MVRYVLGPLLQLMRALYLVLRKLVILLLYTRSCERLWWGRQQRDVIFWFSYCSMIYFKWKCPVRLKEAGAVYYYEWSVSELWPLFPIVWDRFRDFPLMDIFCSSKLALTVFHSPSTLIRSIYIKCSSHISGLIEIHDGFKPTQILREIYSLQLLVTPPRRKIPFKKSFLFAWRFVPLFPLFY